MTGSIVTVTVSLLLLVVCQVDGNDGQVSTSDFMMAVHPMVTRL